MNTSPGMVYGFPLSVIEELDLTGFKLFYQVLWNKDRDHFPGCGHKIVHEYLHVHDHLPTFGFFDRTFQDQGFSKWRGLQIIYMEGRG